MSKKTVTKKTVPELPESKVKAAGVLILTRSEPRQFLLMRHPDRWDLPKGHCDAGEGYLDTAKREMTEETGLPADACALVDDFHFDQHYDVSYPDQPGKVVRKNVRYFLAFVPCPCKITVTEHESYRWFDWSPPHHIQPQTIDPLLASVAAYLECLK